MSCSARNRVCRWTGKRTRTGFLDGTFGKLKICIVSSQEIIEEITRLPADEQRRVIRFAYSLDAERRLSGPELNALAEKMVNAPDPAQALWYRDAIVRGFTGTEIN